MVELIDGQDFSPYPDAHSTSTSMAWVVERLNQFAPFDDDDQYSPARTKPFIELSLMLAVFAAANDGCDLSASSTVQVIGRHLHAVSARTDYTDWALRFPAEIVNYAELCAALDESGFGADSLKRRVQRAVDAGAHAQFERLPHRLLELSAALDWAGITHSLPSSTELCGQTILGGPVSVPDLHAESIYAITHVIIFGSRFGLRPDAVPDWLRSESIRSLLCDLLVVTSQMQNWDMLGEVLLSWDCLGFEHDLVTAAAWASFRGAFRSDGGVVPRAPRKSDAAAAKDTSNGQCASDTSDFSLVYHTTLVAILAQTVYLYQSRMNSSTPAESVSHRPRSRSSRVGGDFRSGATVPDATPTAIAENARRWLTSLAERIPATGEVAVRAHCNLLVSAWIADEIATSGDGSRRFSNIAKYVAHTLDSPENSTHIDTINPTLKLLVEILLSSEGLEVSTCRQFFAQTLSILERADPALRANRSLVEKRILLYRVGALPMPEVLPTGDLQLLLTDFQLSASAHVIDALTVELECLTGWGTLRTGDDVITPAVTAIVAGCAVQRLRNYELVPAARLLRLLEYFAAQGLMPRREDLHRNLLFHCRSHGPFGWYGPEAAKLRQSPSPADGYRELLADTELYLPATLESLRTIAEVSMKDWRLFSRLPAYTAGSTGTQMEGRGRR